MHLRLKDVLHIVCFPYHFILQKPISWRSHGFQLLLLESLDLLSNNNSICRRFRLRHNSCSQKSWLTLCHVISSTEQFTLKPATQLHTGLAGPGKRRRILRALGKYLKVLLLVSLQLERTSVWKNTKVGQGELRSVCVDASEPVVFLKGQILTASCYKLI